MIVKEKKKTKTKIKKEGKVTPNKWATSFKIHTHLPHGECDIQMDQHVEQFCLNFTPPLYNILVQFITAGVHISCGSVQLLFLMKFTLPV